MSPFCSLLVLFIAHVSNREKNGDVEPRNTLNMRKEELLAIGTAVANCPFCHPPFTGANDKKLVQGIITQGSSRLPPSLCYSAARATLGCMAELRWRVFPYSAEGAGLLMVASKKRRDELMGEELKIFG
jgi:hypothetical protein